MALVTRKTAPDYDASTASTVSQIPNLIAGEDIPTKGCPCYIAADGKAYLSNGTANTAPARCRGWSDNAAKAGRPVTLFRGGVRFAYAAAGTLTPGADYYVAATAGRLDTAPTTGGLSAVAFAVSDTDIMTITPGAN